MAEPTDVLSLDAAKDSINMSTVNVKDEAVLRRQVAAVSSLMDDLVGPVVQRTVTDEEHDCRTRRVRLYHRPVASVTTVKESRYGSVSTLTAVDWGTSGDGYYAAKWSRDPSLLSGTLTRRFGSRDVPFFGPVQVTYVAGRYEDTASVAPRFTEAAGEVLRRLWKRESAIWSQAASFLEEDDMPIGAGFFKAVNPVLSEMLPADIQTSGFA